MPERIRVGLVGCGRIARVHRGYLQQLQRVELVGVCDSDAAARTAFASASGLRPFGSLDELLQQGRPDAVHVLTPPASHAGIAIRLLEAGVNVLVEKPLALSTAEADTVLDAARKSGRWVTVDHNRWFDPVVQEAAGTVASGRIGDVVGVEVFQGAEVGEAATGGATHWSLQLPGGVLHNLASHPLYLMRRFAGPVSDLHVVARITGGRTLEEVRLVAMGERAPASVTMSVRTRPFTNRLAIYGSEATIEVNLNNMTLVEHRPRRLPKLIGKVWPNASHAGQLVVATARNTVSFIMGRQRLYPGIGAHLRLLYDQMAAGAPPPVSAAEARDVVAWYDEILAQAGIRTDVVRDAVAM